MTLTEQIIQESVLRDSENIEPISGVALSMSALEQIFIENDSQFDLDSADEAKDFLSLDIFLIPGNIGVQYKFLINAG